MTEAEVYATLTGMFRKFFGDPTLVLAAETEPRDIEGWDSAKTVTIILEIEEAFGFEMTSDEMDKLRSVGDFVEVILSRTSGTTTQP